MRISTVVLAIEYRFQAKGNFGLSFETFGLGLDWLKFGKNRIVNGFTFIEMIFV